MSYALEEILTILSSPYLLYATTISSSFIACTIAVYVKTNGHISSANTVMKYHNRIYSILSLLLCIGIAQSLWNEIASPPRYAALADSILCDHSDSNYDLKLRYLFHASKFYEYLDIFMVLAVGGTVNAHFGFHHFTVRPNLTIPRSH